jgi:Polysaccharide deacetylase
MSIIRGSRRDISRFRSVRLVVFAAATVCVNVASGAPAECGLPAFGSGGFSQPAGTPGNLSVLDWAGFKGAVTYTFDDANQSQVSNYPALQALGVHYTFFLIGNKIAANVNAWKQAVADGHEIGNETQTHSTPSLQDVAAGDQTIRSTLGANVYTMANPNGDTSYTPFAQQFYFLDRGVANGLMLPNAPSPDPFNLFAFIPPTSAPASAFNSQVDSARSSSGWRVFVVHGFTGGTDGAYQPVDIAQFVAAVNYSKGLGDVWIDTFANVGAYWRGQLAFSGAAVGHAGSGQTWTWTLPSHFPPGKCLRVKVDGGTLAQNGTPLVWDTHGYYEVSLDAGSLTLSSNPSPVPAGNGVFVLVLGCSVLGAGILLLGRRVEA